MTATEAQLPAGDATDPAAAVQEARRSFGKHVTGLLKARKRSSASLAGAVGNSVAYMRRIEAGSSATPLPVALRIVRTLDAEPGLGPAMIWWSIVGCGLGPEECAYLLKLIGVLAARECEPLQVALDLLENAKEEAAATKRP